jgi:DNA-binding IclR family transcriptional regulator
VPGTPAVKERNPLARGVGLLTAMIDRGETRYGVRRLAQEVGLPPSTVHRLLSLLEGAGMVTQTDSGEYELALEFHRLAWRTTSRHPVKAAALPILHDLAGRTGESAMLGLYDAGRGEMLFAARVESQHPLRYVSELDRWAPLHAGAGGLAILAQVPADQRRRILANAGLRPVTRHTIGDPQRLEQELDRVRAAGCAVTHSERVEGAVGVAAPVFGAGGGVVGDILLTLPEQRFQDRDEARLRALVMARLSDLLGAGQRAGG